MNAISCRENKVLVVVIIIDYFSVLQEEFEDTVGNVVTKKTYEDLRRQGLL